MGQWPNDVLKNGKKEKKTLVKGSTEKFHNVWDPLIINFQKNTSPPLWRHKGSTGAYVIL